MQVNVHRERACAHRLVLYTRESTGIANGGQLPHGNLYSTDLPPLLDFSSLEIDTRFSAIFHGVGSLSFSRLLCAFECARTFFNDRRRATPVYHDQRAICGTVDPRINQYRPPALILRQRIFNSATAYRIFMLKSLSLRSGMASALNSRPFFSPFSLVARCIRNKHNARVQCPAWMLVSNNIAAKTREYIYSVSSPYPFIFPATVAHVYPVSSFSALQFKLLFFSICFPPSIVCFFSFPALCLSP